MIAIIGAALLSPEASAQPAQGGAVLTPEQIEKNQTEAKSRYKAGLSLYDDGAYDAARVQFERAYELAPSYKILYNIGLVFKQLNEFVAALKAFKQYVKEGGAEVPAERKAEVQKMIDALQSIIGSVTVTTNLPGVDVSVDDAVVGKSPIREPIPLNPGRRKISGAKEGRMPAVRVITVASGDAVDVMLDLAEPPKQVIRQGVDWRPLVGWSGTAAFAVATGITGYLTLRASSDLNDLRNKRGNDATVRSDLDSQYSTMKTFALITDILAGVTLIGAGVSTYFTFFVTREGDEKKPKDTPPPVGFRLMPGAVTGTF